MKVGILGATGAVGQKFIRLLQDHPWFTITALGASERSSGSKYTEAVNWVEDIAIPINLRDVVVRSCSPNEFQDVDFVFSGLDSAVAGDIEESFARAGIPVISNAKNFRMDETVPLLVPEVNPDHVDLIKKQQFTEDGSGWIVTNPNCVAIPLSFSLKPLHEAFGVDSIALTTMQAISGAGYPGVPSLDILGNVVPYISGEEPKIRPETQKLLGIYSDRTIDQPEIKIDATATRVPTLNGHMLSVNVKLKNPPADFKQVTQAYKNWMNPISDLNLPSAPKEAILLHDNEHYPQPRLHADHKGGMQVHVGRLRKAEVYDVSYIAMAHNTIRGAAGGAILNAELLKNKGYLKEKVS